MNIIARKPKPGTQAEYIVVNRGPEHAHPFVSATADAHSLSHGEWFWGHYFKTEQEAIEHFNNRGRE